MTACFECVSTYVIQWSAVPCEDGAGTTIPSRHYDSHNSHPLGRNCRHGFLIRTSWIARYKVSERTRFGPAGFLVISSVAFVLFRHIEHKATSNRSLICNPDFVDLTMPGIADCKMQNSSCISILPLAIMSPTTV